MDEVKFQSPFGEWRVRSMAPPLDLAAVIDQFWETRGVAGYGYEKLLPAGTVEFMINLGPPQLVLQRPEERSSQQYRHAWLAGLQDAPMFTAPAHGAALFETHFVSASLRPDAVRRIFGVDAIDTSRAVIEAEDLCGSKIRSLRDRVGESEGTAARFAALIDFFREQRSRRSRPAPFAAVWAMGKTLATHGNLSVDDLCGELGVSRKHLNMTYRAATGLSPKTYARLTRFRSVIDRLQQPGSEAWAAIALDRGYFDQAHLIRDFKHFAGETPTAFMQHRSPDGESVNFSERPEADSGR